MTLTRRDGTKDFVQLDAAYLLTYDMAIEVLGEHRTEVEVRRKKLDMKLQALHEAIETISEGFPHFKFEPAQSCFQYTDNVEIEKEGNAKKLREALVHGEIKDRACCGCCIII